MDDQPGKILSDIENAIDHNDFRQALSLITENAVPLLSSHDIKPVMLYILKIPENCYDTCYQKLIKGWLLFLCGENNLFSQVMEELDEALLASAVERSLYYSLKAISAFSESREDGLKYAKLSVDVLDRKSGSFFSANARLAYGQLLSVTGEHRKAMEEFLKAYRLFKKNRSYFPAVVSLVNYGLKKHALGEISDVTTFLKSELAACDSLDKSGLFELLKLPLGIAFFELNRQSKAVEYLESVKTRIYDLDFVHMFGVLEMHLVHVYALSGLYLKAYALIDELLGRLSGFNFEGIGTLCAALRVHVNIMEGAPVSEPDIELLESDYLINGPATPVGTLMTLARLKLAGRVENFNMNDLITCHKALETGGNVPLSQTAAILISEYYYRIREMDSSREYLEKAVDIFMNYRLKARFLLERAECLSMLREINRDLFKLIDRKPESGSGLLTRREREILMLVARGYSNGQISKELLIGTGTAKWHINNIFGKLRVKKRSQAIAQAKKLGLLRSIFSGHDFI